MVVVGIYVPAKEIFSAKWQFDSHMLKWVLWLLFPFFIFKSEMFVSIELVQATLEEIPNRCSVCGFFTIKKFKLKNKKYEMWHECCR